MAQHPHAFEIANLGERCTTELRMLIERIAKELRVEPEIQQPGDGEQTFADVTRVRALVGYAPTTSVAEGGPRCVEWSRESVVASARRTP